MRHIRGLFAIVLVALITTACFGSGSSPSASASPSAPPSAPTSEEPSAPPTASEGASGEPSAEPIPSDELGPFTCDLPIHVDQTVARAQITDVRIGTHDGYDRVVFEFAGGLPEAFLERVEPPFTQDPTGMPMEVEGSSYLRLIMRGGTKQTEDGTSSYDGPTEFDPGFPALVDLVEGGDFEAQSTWYFGLTEESCVRVLTLDEEPRIVIDIEQ